ncbi:MAG: ComEC/Rec2 family competence protein [Parachlamydiales bacterium]|jgi:competence protein ComEC
MLNSLTIFWGRYPALLYGISFLLGVSTKLWPSLSLIFPLIFLWIPLLSGICTRYRKLLTRLLLSALVFFSGYFYAGMHKIDLTIPSSGIYGTAVLELQEASYKKTAIGPRWFVKGTLLEISTQEGTFTPAIPVKLVFNGKENAFVPSLRTVWKVEGTLKLSNAQGTFQFKSDPKSPWVPLSQSWKGLFYEKRQEIKDGIKEYIQIHLNNRSGPFLGGMIVGEFDDIVLRHQFGKFGLQHILAISGFHFSLLALALGIFFRLFLPFHYVNIALIVVLTGYFILLGLTPSVIRAWAAIVLALSAYFISRRPSGLNLLGAGLLAVLLIDPLYAAHMGFQFSFGITAAILLFCSRFERSLNRLVPTRPLNIASAWNTAAQHCYIAAYSLKGTLALSSAVNIAAIPLVLYHFHSFPLFSLIYNLFFPFFIGISLLLLLLGVFAHAVLGDLGTVVHWLNAKYTHFVMGMALDAPPSMDIQWYIPEIPVSMILLVMSLIFAAGCWLKMREDSCNDTDIIF